MERHIHKNVFRWLGSFIAILFFLLNVRAELSENLQDRIISVFENKSKAVAKIFATCEGEEGAALYIGTGFFISCEGLLMTNAQVTDKASRVWIEHDGIIFQARILGQDAASNLSILALQNLPKEFSYVQIGDATELSPVGTLLLGITCELGLDPGPSLGMITGWNTNYGDHMFPTVYLRSDMPCDGGEGGSPVFDLNGRFVGMMVAALPEIRSSFLIPALALQRLRDDILFDGKVTYGWFGLQTREISDQVNGTRVVVEEVKAGSPAEIAGLQPGDILKKVGDYPIGNDINLRWATFFIRPGQFVNVQIKREGEEHRFSLKVENREAVTDNTLIP